MNFANAMCTAIVLSVLISCRESLATKSQAQDAGHSSPAAAVASVEDFKQNWPSFRGFGAIGHALAANPPLMWNDDAEQHVVWKTPIAKHGMSSPVVWQGRLFLTGADDTSRDIYCLDTKTGDILWTHSVANLPDSPSDGRLPDVLIETGFAAPTVATNGRFIAAIFATGELVCVDMQGDRIWAKHLGTPLNFYGHASSLICDEDLLFVQYDQKENSKLLAFTLATGESAWQTARDNMSWSSPILVDNRGRRELILTDNKSVAGYDPKTGERYWHVECLDGEVAPSAAYSDGNVFVAVENSAASAIDISDHAKEPPILWQWEGDLPDSASLLANEDFLLVPTAYGVVTCLNATKGDVRWEHQFSNGFCSSPVLVNGRVYLCDRRGVMHVFQIGAEFKPLGDLNVGEPIYATPAFVGDRIFIRGLQHLFCIGAAAK